MKCRPNLADDGALAMTRGPLRSVAWGWEEAVAVRFSGERLGPRESTPVHLSRPDDLIGHLGVQDRLHVSATVVSTALAAGSSIRRSDLPLARRRVRSGLPTSPEGDYEIARAPAKLASATAETHTCSGLGSVPPVGARCPQSTRIVNGPHSYSLRYALLICHLRSPITLPKMTT